MWGEAAARVPRTVGDGGVEDASDPICATLAMSMRRAHEAVAARWPPLAICRLSSVICQQSVNCLSLVCQSIFTVCHPLATVANAFGRRDGGLLTNVSHSMTW